MNRLSIIFKCTNILIHYTALQRASGRDLCTDNQRTKMMDYMEVTPPGKDEPRSFSLFDKRRPRTEKAAAWTDFFEHCCNILNMKVWTDLKDFKHYWTNKKSKNKTRLNQHLLTGQGYVKPLEPLDRRFQDILDQIPGVAKGKEVSVLK